MQDFKLQHIFKRKSECKAKCMQKLKRHHRLNRKAERKAKYVYEL